MFIFISFYDFTMSNDIKMKCLWHENEECRQGDCKNFQIMPLDRSWIRICLAGIPRKEKL